MRFLFSIITIVWLSGCAPTTDDLYNKAGKLIDKKRYSEAIKVYDQILKKNPGFEDAQLSKAWCYLQDSNYAKAVHFFNLLLDRKNPGNSEFVFEVNPNGPLATEEDRRKVTRSEIYYHFAVTEYMMDSLRSAYRKFQYCVDNNYEVGTSYIWQGIIWLQSDDSVKACEFFRKSKFSGDKEADYYINEYCR